MALLENSSEKINLDTSIAKVSAIGIVGVILAAILGYFVNEVIGGAPSLVPLLIAATAFFTVFLLQTLYIKSFRIISGIILLETIAVTALFLPKFSGGVLIAWFLLFLIWIMAVKNGRSSIENQIKVQFFRVERSVLPHALTAFAIFIAIVTVWVSGTMLTKDRFAKLVQPIQPIVQGVLSENFTFNMTVSKFAELVLETKFDVNVAALPAGARRQAVGQILNQFRTQYGLTFRNSDAVIDIIFNYIMSWLERIPEPARIAVPLSAALLVFLTAKGISFFLRWIIAFFGWLIYELSLITGFARKEMESRSREVVVL